MKFVETELKGAFTIEPDRQEDERGFFARVFCEKEFAEHGLETHFVQSSISFNFRKGTLRGMHYQTPPHEETKIVRCCSGLIYDVIVDLREGSDTYMKWVGFELSQANRRMVYVPAGFAHGFQTLDDNCEVYYQISADYNPASSRSLYYADRELAIAWPLPVSVVSGRDRSFPSTRSVLLSKA